MGPNTIISRSNMRIDSEMLMLYRTTLHSMGEEERERYVETLLDSIVQEINLADKYAKNNNVNFIAALERIK